MQELIPDVKGGAACFAEAGGSEMGRHIRAIMSLIAAGTSSRAVAINSAAVAGLPGKNLQLMKLGWVV